MNNFLPLYNAENIKEWDRFTIQEQNISSIELMDRAAIAATNWIAHHITKNQHCYIFCGIGNNGGDGFAIARLLLQKNFPLTVFLIGNPEHLSSDALANYRQLDKVIQLQSVDDIPSSTDSIILIDAIMGIGLNRPLENIQHAVVNWMNHSGHKIISIDIPSGWYADLIPPSNFAVQAQHTLSFGILKPSFILPESEQFTGTVEVLDIGLSKNYKPGNTHNFYWLGGGGIQNLLLPIQSFAHKGSHGHAALINGSKGMMGAAILAARACMKSGVGKTTCIIPSEAFDLMHLSTPEVLVDSFSENYNFQRFQSIGIGSGIGINEESLSKLMEVLKQKQPLVIDADAITLLASHQLPIPHHAIFTPHVKEAKALAGEASDSLHLLQNSINFCVKHQVYIVLKGKFSRIICPSGLVYINTTGNPGMATAGMGDVLTGMITSLLAQGYSSEAAAAIGVYWHGLAADLAVKKIGCSSLIASDVIDHLGTAYLYIINSH